MGRFSPRLALPSALKREILHNESDKNVVKRDKSFKSCLLYTSDAADEL